LFLGNHVGYEYTYLDTRAVIGGTADYVAEVQAAIRRSRPGYLIVNPRSAYNDVTPSCLVSAPNEAFPFLIPIKRVGTSIVYMVDYARLPV
jgi:hypothetical protein